MQRFLEITVCGEDGGNSDFYKLSEETSVLKLKQNVELKTGIKVKNLKYKGKKLPFNKNSKLSSLKMEASDVIIADFDMTITKKLIEDSVPKEYFFEPEKFKNFVKGNPTLMSHLIKENSVLAEAVMSDDHEFLRDALSEYSVKIRQNYILEKNKNNQKAIESTIQQNNIRENMESALEHAPELFVRVEMLYVPCLINGFKINAFVDSGAQQTIMSKNMAAKTGLLRIVDRNFGGLAKGVGVARILGRIHITTVKIGNCVLPCSISVIDSDGVDFLLGLDMLKRHLIEIDLRKKVLRIGNEEIGFVRKEQNEDRSEILRSVERMGFSREKAEHALETTGWDIDAAIQLLTQ